MLGKYYDYERMEKSMQYAKALKRVEEDMENGETVTSPLGIEKLNNIIGFYQEKIKNPKEWDHVLISEYEKILYTLYSYRRVIEELRKN